MFRIAWTSDKAEKNCIDQKFLSKHLPVLWTGDVFIYKARNLRSSLIYYIDEILFNISLQLFAKVYWRLVPVRIRQYKPWNESPFFMFKEGKA